MKPTKEEETVNVELFSRGIKKVDYHISTGFDNRGKRKVSKYIKLETAHGIIYISDIKARRQFLNHLSLGLRETENIDSVAKRNETVMEAIKDRSFDELSNKRLPLVFRCHLQNDGTYNAWSCVTTDYIEVPSKEALAYFENVLEERGFGDSKVVKQWDNGKAVCTIFDLWESPTSQLKVGDLASCGVVLQAGYSGDRAVSLRGFFNILACTNGMMNSESIMAYRGVHRGIPKPEILAKLENAFDMVTAEMPLLEDKVKRAEETVLTKEEEQEILDKVLGKYPRHIKEKVKEAMKKYLETQGTYRISQALSDTATHYKGVTDNYRTELQKEAFKVLTIPKPKPKKKEEKT